MNTEPIAEKDLAQRLNLSRNVLRDLRHQLLVQDVDFTLSEKNGAVILNPCGVEKLQERLTAGDGGGQQSLEEVVRTPEVAPEIHTFYVSRTFPQVVNVRIVLATSDPQLKEKPVTIRVKDNRLYALRSTIYAIRGDGPVFTVHGRAPRWRGQKLPLPAGLSQPAPRAV